MISLVFPKFVFKNIQDMFGDMFPVNFKELRCWEGGKTAEFGGFLRMGFGGSLSPMAPFDSAA